jgi:hypothetical protein
MRLGSMVKPIEFPIATYANRRQMTIWTAAIKFQTYYPTKRISKALQSLSIAPELTEWRDIKNAMTHRQMPRKVINVSVSVTIGPGTGPSGRTGTRALLDDSSTGGTREIDIDDQTTQTRRHWFVDTVKELVEAALDFTKTEF